MSTMTSAISTAIKVQATREGVTLTSIADAAGLGRTAFFERLSNKRGWSTDTLEKVAIALHLESAWELFDLASAESRFADSSVGRVA